MEGITLFLIPSTNVNWLWLVRNEGIRKRCQPSQEENKDMDSPFFLFNKGDKVRNPSYGGIFTFIDYTTETRQFSRVRDYTGLERIFYSSDLQAWKEQK